MSTIQQLRERKQEISRVANKQLADKGSATWSKEEQQTFDNHMEEMERLDTQISAHERLLQQRADEHFTNVENKPQDKKVKTEGEIAIEAFLRKKPENRTAEEATAIRNTMSTTTGSQGGYTVDPIIARQYIDELADYGGMRRVADRMVTATGVPINWPTTDGRAEIGEIVAQNAAASSADPAFGTVALGAYRFSSKIITIPIELLQDSTIDIIKLVNQRSRDRIGRIQNTKFTIGSGTNEPTGLTTAATVGVTGATGQTVTIIYDNFVDLIDSVDVAYQTGGDLTWNMSQAMRRVVRKIKDTAGRPIFLPGYGSIQEGFGDALLGYSININNDMPTPAANAKSLSFGQHKKYMVRDSLEVSLMRFDDSAFATKGQVGFLAFARADGNLLDTVATKTYQHSAT